MKLAVLAAIALATIASLAGPARAGAAKLDWDRFFGMTEAQLAAAHAPFTPSPTRDRTHIATIYGQQGDALLWFHNGRLNRISVGVVGQKKVRAVRAGILRAYNVVLAEGPPEHACVSDDQWIGVEPGLLPYKIALSGIGPQCPSNVPILLIILQWDRDPFPFGGP